MNSTTINANTLDELETRFKSINKSLKEISRISSEFNTSINDLDFKYTTIQRQLSELESRITKYANEQVAPQMTLIQKQIQDLANSINSANSVRHQPTLASRIMWVAKVAVVAGVVTVGGYFLLPGLIGNAGTAAATCLAANGPAAAAAATAKGLAAAKAICELFNYTLPSCAGL